MLVTDINGPRSLQPRHAGLGRISRPVVIPVSIALILCCATFGASGSRAQDQQTQSVAEAARRERAKKQDLKKHADHVYTNEDLARAHILNPKDSAEVEARKTECAQKNNCSPARSQNSPAGLDANSQTPGTSLGEVARRYRKQKELQALKPKQSEPFHLSIGSPALASPILPERPAIRRLPQPALEPKIPAHVFRRDPFSAVPLRPRAPFGNASDIRPAIRPSAKPVSPAQPKISSRSVPSSKIFVQPSQPVPVSESPKPAKSVLKIQPVLPSVPRTARTPISPSAPANVLRSSNPVAIKNIFPSLKPVAPVETVRPLSSSSSLAPVASANQRTIVIQSGDSLWKLAEQNFGRGSRWPELLAANPSIANPNLIRAGAHLNLPVTATTPVLAHAANATISSIRIRTGDTLWSVARSHLGHGASWTCIARANASVADPNMIFEGQVLALPDSCTP